MVKNVSIFLFICIICYLIYGLVFYNHYFRFNFPFAKTLFMVPFIVLTWPIIIILMSMEDLNDDDRA